VAKKTVLATGGLGGIFLHTTNQPGSVGHGVAMAYRVGARLIDLEYVQFHPTVFAKKNAHRFLVTEALRGEGGVLVNARGRAFHGCAASAAVRSRRAMSWPAPSSRNWPRAARRASSSIFPAMKPEFIRERFPTSIERCLRVGVDITREPIPVVPAAHFSCGGVHTDLHGRTNIRHLNAIGETGLHRPARGQPAREHLAARVPGQRAGRRRRRCGGHHAGQFHLPVPGRGRARRCRPGAGPAGPADPAPRCGTTPA
jgi:L-aspartate oxidase